MAKKNKDEVYDVDKGEKGGSKIATILLTLLIIIVWLAIFALLIKFDVGGFGSNVLSPLLKDVPIINKILPDTEEEEEEDATSGTTGKKAKYTNLDEANARIAELESMLDSLSNNKDYDSSYVAELEAENERLKVFEENQLEYEELKKQFDNEVVFAENAPSYEEYIKYYEAMDPENAAEIYRQVVEQQQGQQKALELAERYSNMEPEKAAAILEGMTGDLDLVSQILMNMKTKQAALIIQEMNTDQAAKVTKKMSLMSGE